MASRRSISRPDMLKDMRPGDSMVFEAKNGAARLAQQIQADVSRAGLGTGRFTTSVVVGVELATRRAVDMVIVTRKPDNG